MRGRLLVGTGLLAVVQLAHLLDVLHYDESASFPAVLGHPLAVFGIGATTVAFVLPARRDCPRRGGGAAEHTTITSG